MPERSQIRFEICSPGNPYTKERDEQSPGALWTHKETREAIKYKPVAFTKGKSYRECIVCGMKWWLDPAS